MYSYYFFPSELLHMEGVVIEIRRGLIRLEIKNISALFQSQKWLGGN